MRLRPQLMIMLSRLGLAFLHLVPLHLIDAKRTKINELLAYIEARLADLESEKTELAEFNAADKVRRACLNFQLNAPIDLLPGTPLLGVRLAHTRAERRFGGTGYARG